MTLSLDRGTITGIVGPSGCGKSTLIRAMVGVWPVLRGTVRYDGANIENWDPESLGRVRTLDTCLRALNYLMVQLVKIYLVFRNWIRKL